MLPQSLNYQSIFANPHDTEIMMIVGEPGDTRTTIPAGNILSLDTHYSIYGDYYDIGNAVIGSFNAILTGFTDAQIPKLSRVEVWYRIKNNSQTSGWICKGIYYTKRPEYDKESGRLSLSGYDMMYRAETVPYPVGSTVSGWNNETLATVAQRMATAMGVSLYPFLTLRTDAFALPPFGYSAREVLCDIAKAHGGNWYLTYINDGDETTPVGGAYLNLRQINGWGTPPNVPNLGKSVQGYQEGGVVNTVGYVIVNYGYDQDGATLSKFSGTEGTGRTVEYTISTITDGDVIQTLADNILYEFGQVTVYEPFSATGTELDPAYEVGDVVTCNGRSAAIGSLDTHFSVAMYADISAPGTPEDEDFPYYSSDRDIQRNYETEASKIAGAVKFVDLSTAGGTVINGSNIQGGTLTLGGNNNGNGQMQILDENDALIGQWNNNGVVLKDDVSLDTSAQLPKFKLQKKGTNDYSQFGVFLGLQRNALNDDQIDAYIRLESTEDGTNTSGKTIIEGDFATFRRYPAQGSGLTGEYLVAIDSLGQVQLARNIQDSGGNSYVNTTTISSYPANIASPISRTSGVSISSQNAHKWGRLVNIQLILLGDGGWHAAPSDLFKGTISSALLPYDGKNAFGVGYYDGAALVGRIQSDGTVTVRVTGQGITFASGGGAVITWTYMI